MSIWGINARSFSNRYIALSMFGANRQMSKLVSGDRIFAASEDPAGLVISENLRSQIASLNAEIENLSATSGKYSYADSVLSQLHSQLVEMRSLAVGATNEATNSPEAQSAYDQAAQDLVAQYNRAISESSYNGHSLLDGSTGALAAMTELHDIDLSNSTSAESSIGILDNAIREVQQAQVDLGSTQKYEYNGRRVQLEITRENLIASESGIRDADFASEYLEYVVNLMQERVGLALSSYARFSGVDVLKLLDRKDA